MTAARTPPSVFDRIVAVTFALEGRDKLSLDPSDPGNWTGGKTGLGVLRGTRWGFSAAAFPDLDIEHVDQAHATGLAFAHFWLPTRCGAMPNSVALLVFDAAFQHGAPKAIEMLQRALGVHVDGDPGAETLGAVRSRSAGQSASAQIMTLCIAFQAQRMLHMAAQPSWARDGLGLAFRLGTTLAASAHFDDAVSGDGT